MMSKISERLLRPEKLLKEEAVAVALAACVTPERFAGLMQCMLEGDYRLCQRAAWCVSLAVAGKPDLINPYRDLLVEQLGRKNASPALRRNCLRILRDIDIPEHLQEPLVYYAFDFAANPDQPIAIRAFSLHILGHIALRLPDIRGELISLMEYHYDQGSAGLQASIRQVKKLLE